MGRRSKSQDGDNGGRLDSIGMGGGRGIKSDVGGAGGGAGGGGGGDKGDVGEAMMKGVLEEGFEILLDGSSKAGDGDSMEVAGDGDDGGCGGVGGGAAMAMEDAIMVGGGDGGGVGSTFAEKISNWRPEMGKKEAVVVVRVWGLSPAMGGGLKVGGDVQAGGGQELGRACPTVAGGGAYAGGGRRDGVAVNPDKRLATRGLHWWPEEVRRTTVGSGPVVAG